MLEISDAEDLYRFYLGDDDDRHLFELVRGHDLQAASYLIVDRDRVRSHETIGVTIEREGALDMWLQMIRRRLTDDAELRAPCGDGCCIIIGVEKQGVVRIVTWSKRRADCARMQPLVDKIFTQVSIVPFRTVFGWGNDGVPKPLNQTESEQLDRKMYAAVNSVRRSKGLPDLHSPKTGMN